MTPFERIFNAMTRPVPMIGYALLVVLSFFYMDKSIVFYVQSLHLDSHFPVLWLLTHLGESVVYLMALLLMAVFFRYVVHHPLWEERSLFLWLCVLIPNLICLALKILLGRARPELLLNEHLYGFYGLQYSSLYWSLPSGHTTTILGLVCGLSVLFPKKTWFFLITGLIVVASRVLLLQHFLSDVLVAAYLVLLEVGILVLVLRRKICFSRLWVSSLI
jgi:membrane-associated phospholipid phosphatase